MHTTTLSKISFLIEPIQSLNSVSGVYILLKIQNFPPPFPHFEILPKKIEILPKK